MFKLRDVRPRLCWTAALALLVGACGGEVTAPVSQDLGSPSFTIAPPASTLLVDTGPGASAVGFGLSGGSSGFPNWQFLGGQFTLGVESKIESVAGWMKVFLGGPIDVHIRANSGGLPGTSLHSASYTLSVHDFGWNEFANFNVTLAAGTYWLTFEPVVLGGVVASMPNGAASPLANYAFKFNFAPTVWSQSFGSTAPAMGFRVSGFAVTPESMIADLSGYIALSGIPKGNAMAIDSKLQLALDAIAANQTTAACVYLQDVINYTKAQSGKKMPVAVANGIISQATAIRTDLGC